MRELYRLGTVSFLNSTPLTYAIEEDLIENDFELVATPPAELSEKLYRKEVDLALIPVAELLRRKSYAVVPDISISSVGKVDSVILLTRGGVGDTRRVAVDSRSQSSTALLRIILEIFYNLLPDYEPRKYEPKNPEASDSYGEFLKGVDGGMLIGDAGLQCMHSPPEGYRVYDLGEIWTKKTGLPFVYAVFAVNEGIELGRNLDALRRSKAYGLSNLKLIAKLGARKTGLSEEICYRYISQRIKYDLGEDGTRGIIKYSQLLSELGICDKITDLRIYHT